MLVSYVQAVSKSSNASLGIRTVYVYQAFAGIAPADWAPVNDELRAEGMTTFAQTALAAA